MHELSKQYAQCCCSVWDLDYSITFPHYQSLSVCILECIFSLNADYEKITGEAVSKYINIYIPQKKDAADHTVSCLLDNVLADKKKSENKNIECFARDLGIPEDLMQCFEQKARVLVTLCKYLQFLGVETLEDFRHFKYPKLLDSVIVGIDGMGTEGLNYLTMLTGDGNLCRTDKYIRKSIESAAAVAYAQAVERGDSRAAVEADRVRNSYRFMCDRKCQDILSGAVEILQRKHPGLSVRRLGRIVRQYFLKKTFEQ